MPIPLTNGPGVYVQELLNPVRPIVGVPTSVAAFYGSAPQGRVDYPFQVNSWADYENEFGALSRDYPLSYAVRLFFLNGGSTALVVRFNDPVGTTASAQLSTDIVLDASSPGAWGTELSAVVTTTDLVDPTHNKFNLTITQTVAGNVVSTEVYPGANLIKGTPQYLPTLLASSRLVTPAPGNKWTTQPAPGTYKFTPPTAGAGSAGRRSRSARRRSRSARRRSRSARRRSRSARRSGRADAARHGEPENRHLRADEGGHLQHPLSSRRSRHPVPADPDR